MNEPGSRSACGVMAIHGSLTAPRRFTSSEQVGIMRATTSQHQTGCCEHRSCMDHPYSLWSKRCQVIDVVMWTVSHAVI